MAYVDMQAAETVLGLTRELDVPVETAVKIYILSETLGTDPSNVSISKAVASKWTEWHTSVLRMVNRFVNSLYA